MGGSYGGYLTAWLTTRTERFDAAIVERGFLDPVSFVGSSDIGWFFGLQYLGDDHTPEAAAALDAQSPMANVGAVRTPTLVIHSENDWRCPVEQGQRWFVELKRRGVPAELLLFPGEGHELTRSGTPEAPRDPLRARARLVVGPPAGLTARPTPADAQRADAGRTRRTRTRGPRGACPGGRVAQIGDDGCRAVVGRDRRQAVITTGTDRVARRRPVTQWNQSTCSRY